MSCSTMPTSSSGLAMPKPRSEIVVRHHAFLLVTRSSVMMAIFPPHPLHSTCLQSAIRLSSRWLLVDWQLRRSTALPVWR